ncbi:MAG: DNA topoisomerase IB [Burkholderiaceae bacterium]|nr:DNA topoisomerase IB [Burkholderiaceae bacterium]
MPSSSTVTPPGARGRSAAVHTAATQALQACKAGGLKYVDDRNQGITRRLSRGKFAYFDLHGKRIKDPCVVARIDALAIAPAYRDVWICPDELGHIQATARDARGRKQYRYHDDWTTLRDADKYAQLTAFGEALPRIRRAVDKHLAEPGLSECKVLAAAVRLLEITLIRIGTPEYARDNKSYGLTTLRRRHVSLSGQKLRFRFKGKSGVEHDVTINDRRIANVMKRCMEIGGQALLHYRDDTGETRCIASGDVNDFLRDTGKGEFTAKHYRTWSGSVLAMAGLQAIPWESEAQAKRTVVDMVKNVSKKLGNTPSVCRACYIHPAILEHYLAGTLPVKNVAASKPKGLDASERRLYAFLKSLCQVPTH